MRFISAILCTAIVLAEIPVCAEADDTKVFGFCLDQNGQRLPDAFLQIFQLKPGQELSGLSGLQIEPGITPRSSSGQEPIASLTTDDRGFWSIALAPGAYLFTAQELRDGGATKLSAAQQFTIGSVSEAEVPLTLRAEFAIAIPPAFADAQTLFFATDRKRDGYGPITTGTPSFEDDRGVGLQYGRCVVEASGEHRYECTTEATESSLMESYLAAVGKQRLKRGLIYIHGFNVSFADSVRAGAVLGSATHRAVFVYDWASYKSIPHYDSDEENLTWSLGHGRELLVKLLCNRDGYDVSLFAHSMGTRAVVDVLEFILDAERLGAPLAFHSRLVDFAASDLDVSTLQDSLPTFHALHVNVNSYASYTDYALKASRAIHPGHDRVGDDATDLENFAGVISVDATAAAPVSITDPFGHGYFQHPEFLFDIGEYFDGVDPARREHLERSMDGEYWWFKELSQSPQIELNESGLSPDRLEVHPGTLVTLRNASAYSDDFTFSDEPSRSILLNPGESTTRTFSKTGVVVIQGNTIDEKAEVVVK